MTIETEVAALTTAVNALTTTVNVKKATLDASVSTAAISATAAAGSFTAASSQAQNAQSAASLAQGYAASASSVVQQDLSGITSQALHRSPNAITAQFIYDTSKDSDGGAWTEKCQGTSWYNEALAGKWLGPQVSEFEARTSGATLGSELVTNGNFSNGTTGWTLVSSSVVDGALNCSAVISTQLATRSITVVAGRTYQVSFTVTNYTSGVIGLTLGVGANVSTAGVSANGVFTLFLVAGAGNAEVRMTCPGPGFVGTLDNISVREVTALNTASNDYFQLTTDGKFYRLWKNMFTYSQQINSTTYNNGYGGGTFVPNAIAAPDGSMTATKLIPNAGSTNTWWGKYGMQGIPVMAGITYAYSVYVKAAEISTVVLYGDVRDGGGLTASANFTLTGSGSFTLTSGLSAGITSVGNGWYRIYVTSVSDETTNEEPAILWSGAAANGTDGFYVWGFQIEASAAPTTYEAKVADASTSEIFRGNKADFPRLSAIVAEAGNVNIYDLTEPGRPMWMRFINGGFIGWVSVAAITGVAAQNGYVVPVASAGMGGLLLNFPKDDVTLLWGASSYILRYRQIASRNVANVFSQEPGGIAVANSAVNAVAMTVLPDAPIDPATGLRVPTIAVATGGGVSVIKHNGTVVNSSSTAAFNTVGIGGEGVYGQRTSSTFYEVIANPNTLPASFALVIVSNGTAPDWVTVVGGKAFRNKRTLLSRYGDNSNRVQLLENNEAAPTRSLGAAIAPTFNTGWLTGDIRRAYLSDVTAESIVGSELVTNGDFSSGTTGWTAGFGTTTSTLTVPSGAGVLTVVSPDTIPRYGQAIAGLTVGKFYSISCGTFSSTGTGDKYFGWTSASNLTGGEAWYQNHTTPRYLQATATTMYVWFGFNGGSASATITTDNISVREAVADRSYKAQGASLFGTLTKSQLASGTSLVGYSGYSGSNYLREPYSADLDFGTGEWNASAWVNVPATLPAYSTVALGPELVTNGTFDSSTGWSLGSGWSITGGQLVGTSVAGYAFSSFANTAILPYRVYKITFNCTVTSGDLGFGTGNGGQNIDLVSATGSYTRYIVATEITSSEVYFRGNATFTGTVDNVSVKELILYSIADRAFSSGPRIRLTVDNSGRFTAEAFDGTTTRTVTTYAAYNIAQWLKAEANYTTDGSLTIRVNGREVAATRGNPLLTLNNRYNLLLNSEQFEQSSWNKINATVSSNAINSPIGTLTADLILDSTANGEHYVSQGFSCTNGVVYNFIGYLKKKTGSYSTCHVRTYLTGGIIHVIDFDAETITNGGTLTNVGNSWYKFDITRTASATGTGYLETYTKGGGYVGTGTDGHYAWGFQVAAANVWNNAYAYQRVGTATDFDFAPPLTIGNNYTLDAPFPGTIALLKLGATVPTNEQATFMYEQEKQLFRANAQSVLPDTGSVVDMAYDDATDRWVAVSAANESYWTGLVRNTVTPVPAGSYTKIVATSGIELAARSTTNPGVDVTIPAYGLREELVKRAEAAARLGKELVTFDYVGGFTANTTSGNTAITSASTITYPGSYIGARISGSGIPTNATIVAVSGTTLYLSAAATATATTVSITFLDFALPAGMETKVVFNNGVQTREGTTGATFSRLYDGFVETIRFAAAPGATNIVNIQAQRTS